MFNKYDDDYVTVSGCKLLTVTERAILFKIAGEKHWIPKSQIENTDHILFDDEYEGDVRVKEFIADERGLI